MSLLHNKTPISLLHELCDKRSLTANYDVIQVPDGQGFCFKISLNNKEVMGKGLSKKKAKHNAALLMIKHLLKTEDIGITDDKVNMMLGDVTNDNESIASDVSESNYIGELQEKLQKSGIPPVTYLCTDDTSVSPRCFICNIGTDTHKVIGYGKTKKLSKQDAAKKFLLLLKEKPLVEKKPASSVKTSMSLPSVASQRITEFYENDNLSVKSALKGLQNMRLDPDKQISVHPDDDKLSSFPASASQISKEDEEEIDEECNYSYKHYLEELCRQQRFSFTYIKCKDRNERSAATPTCLIMLKISSNPPAMFTGEGHSWPIAESKAAFSSLEYFKNLTSKKSGTQFN